MSTLTIVTQLLQVAITIVSFIQAHPELDEASKTQANQLAMQAITHATQQIAEEQHRQFLERETLLVTPVSGVQPLLVTIEAADAVRNINYGDGSRCTDNPESLPQGSVIPGFRCRDPHGSFLTHTYLYPGTYVVEAGADSLNKILKKVVVTVSPVVIPQQ